MCVLLIHTRTSGSVNPRSGLPNRVSALLCVAVSVEEEATTSARITATSQVWSMRLERGFFGPRVLCECGQAERWKCSTTDRGGRLVPAFGKRRINARPAGGG